MGKFKRIPVKDINAMRKILDDLPDKISANAGGSRRTAQRQHPESNREGIHGEGSGGIMAEGNVIIPAPVIRAKVLPPKAAPRKREPKPGLKP